MKRSTINGRRRSHCIQLFDIRVAAIAPWFHLRLPSRGPGFESQAHHLRFFQYVLLKLYQENNENKQKKRLGLAHFLQLLDKNTFLLSFPKLCRSWLPLDQRPPVSQRSHFCFLVDLDLEVYFVNLHLGWGHHQRLHRRRRRRQWLQIWATEKEEDCCKKTFTILQQKLWYCDTMVH